MSRVQAFDLKHHGFERVARQCLLAMRGESGMFAVCVTPSGQTTVVRPRHDVANVVGVFTAFSRPEVMEDILMRKQQQITGEPQKRGPGLPMEV
jgi:hypothetical protein